MNKYTIDDVTLFARNYRTAKRRVRGYLRGELDSEGRTILATKRKPPGHSLKKRRIQE